VRVRFGEAPGSELGGEPRSAGLRFRRGPQWNVPDSDGGVKVEMMRSTCALAAFGLDVSDSAAVSACGGCPSGGLSA